MAVTTVTIDSLAELIARVTPSSPDPATGRHRDSGVYRGAADASWPLLTSLDTLGGVAPPHGKADLEEHILRNFIRYSRPFFTVAPVNEWEVLIAAQHHGLPTRLLDWTYSPNVAMHFATDWIETFDRDGVIWCVDYVKAHQLLPQALRDVLKQEAADVFTAEMLDPVADNVSTLDELGKDDPFVLFMEPPSLDDRIVNQFALFSLMSNPTAELGDWVREHPDLCRRLVIPAELKWEVRDKLDQANVTERVLFPGLDGLCRWLKRYYSPRV